MKLKLVALAAALGCAACGTLPTTQLAGAGEFPPPVIAGVTRFAQVVAPEPAPPDTAVPPSVIWGVTRFTQVAPDLGVPDSSVPQPVIWARFGVTREAAARETAQAGGGAGGSVR